MGHKRSDSWAGAVVFSRVWPDAGGPFYAIAAVVSVSRIYLGAHGPGDVLVGSLIGLVSGALLSRPFERLDRWLPAFGTSH
ncbi:MAG: phosphatase PAP2 family protein [Chloroflexi bacterium]|nr:phosphatase PAP2 family protein [Chloroflexota bacterium]MBV9895048.1 phosphatase PAP2 family protein [Chloroflexota bacterium]